MAIVVEESTDVSDVIAWSTREEVSQITGLSEDDLTDDELQRAQFIIDLVSGRTLDMRDLLINENRKRDLRWLRMAVAYQVAWMKAQPDLFTRWDLTRTSQDGENSDFVPGATTLAPLAKRAIRRLSWKGTRSVSIGLSGYDNEDGMTSGPLIDRSSDVWEPM